MNKTNKNQNNTNKELEIVKEKNDLPVSNSKSSVSSPIPTPTEIVASILNGDTGFIGEIRYDILKTNQKIQIIGMICEKYITTLESRLKGDRQIIIESIKKSISIIRIDIIKDLNLLKKSVRQDILDGLIDGLDDINNKMNKIMDNDLKWNDKIKSTGMEACEKALAELKEAYYIDIEKIKKA